MYIHLSNCITLQHQAKTIYVCLHAAILSALRNLQEKIRRLELEKEQAELSLCSLGKNASRTLQGDRVAQRLLNDHVDTERGMSGQSSCKKGEHIAAF